MISKNRIILVFVVAFLFRLIAINQSFWLDETITANVTQMSFGQILFQFSPSDFHPPLYYLMTKCWSLLFSNSEISLRFFSSLAILGAGWFIYLSASRLKGQWGIWAAVFFLFNPLVIYYSHEARMYGLNLFFLAGATHFWLSLYAHRLHTSEVSPIFTSIRSKHLFHLIYLRLRTIFHNLPTHPHLPDSTDLLWFNIFAGCAMLTFYGSIFYLAALIIITASSYKWQSCVKLILGPLIALTILSPLLLTQLKVAHTLQTLVPNWKMVLGPANGKNLTLLFLKLTSGRISFEPKIVYIFLASLWALFVSWIAIINWRKSQLFWGLSLATISLCFVASIFVPMFSYFRLLYLVIPLAFILSEEVRAYFREVLLMIFVIWGLVYLFDPIQHREDWRSLASSLPTSTQLVMVKSSSDPILYYSPTIKVFDFSEIDNLAKRVETIAVIPYVTDIHGIDYRQKLQLSGFQLAREKSFHLLKLEYWSKKPQFNVNPNASPVKYRKL